MDKKEGTSNNIGGCQGCKRKDFHNVIEFGSNSYFRLCKECIKELNDFSKCIK